MFKNNKKTLFRKIKGTGGLVLVFVATVGALTLTSATRLSSIDMAKSMINSSAYFATYRAAVLLYNSSSPSGVYNLIDDKSSGIKLNPMNEFNNLLISSFDGKAFGTSNFSVSWDKNTGTATSVNVGAIKTIMSKDDIRPETQVVVIE